MLIGRTFSLLLVLIVCSCQEFRSTDVTGDDSVIIECVDERGLPITNALVVGYNSEHMGPTQSGLVGKGPREFLWSEYAMVGVVGRDGHLVIAKRVLKSCRFIAIIGADINSHLIELRSSGKLVLQRRKPWPTSDNEGKE